MSLSLDRAARVEEGGRRARSSGAPRAGGRVGARPRRARDGASGASAAFRDALFDAQQRGPQPLRAAGELGVVPGRVPIVPIEPTMQGLEVDEAAVGFVTDADGRFVVEDVLQAWCGWRRRTRCSCAPRPRAARCTPARR
ncbi:MAG: hypothetical protein R3A52_04695 [Polyangiales bacterium]